MAGGYSPSAAPLRLALSGTVAPDGTLTISQSPAANFWSSVTASAQVAGGGDWVFGTVGTPIIFDQGANVYMGPVVLSPNEPAVLTLVGATPGSEVLVILNGLQGTMGDALAYTAPAGRTSLAITGPVTIGGTVPVTGNVGVTGSAPGATPVIINSLQTEICNVLPAAGNVNLGNFTVPAGTQTLMCAVSGIQSSPHPVSEVSITGVQTGVNPTNGYASVYNGSPPLLIPWLGLDTEVRIQTINFDGATQRLYVLALPVVMAVDITDVITAYIDSVASSVSVQIAAPTSGTLLQTMIGVAAAEGDVLAVWESGDTTIPVTISGNIETNGGSFNNGFNAIDAPTSEPLLVRAVSISASFVNSAGTTDSIVEFGAAIFCGTSFYPLAVITLACPANAVSPNNVAVAVVFPKPVMVPSPSEFGILITQMGSQPPMNAGVAMTVVAQTVP